MRFSALSRLTAVASVAVLTLGVAGCGSSTAAAPAPVAAPMVTATVDGCGIAVSNDTRAAPKVSISACATKPTALGSADVVVGSGASVGQGQNVTVQYVGIVWSTRKQFVSSWTSGKPLLINGLGSNLSVAMGWNFGLVGARVGGRRILVFPSDMAFGPTGGSGVGPDETVVYVADIVSITRVPTA